MRRGNTEVRLNIKNNPSRVRLLVNGVVQGVGFRPTVYRLAHEIGLGGFVKNTGYGVIIEIEGKCEAIESFLDRLLKEAPPLSSIDSVDAEEIEVLGEEGFRIETTEVADGHDTFFPVDTATCADCLKELFDSEDRRYRYPFINCTNCGPRFTIIESLPYDREFTTMKVFQMDEYCRLQYENPLDRRFHAEPISCPQCGPVLKLVDSAMKEVEGDPIEVAKEAISRGAIVAVKGLGGYHLACLATDSSVVKKLRERKKRPSKPFAVMFKDIDVVRKYCEVNDTESELLLSPQAPIVLLRAREENLLPEEVAPSNAYIGAFLPYTPVHHLLMENFEALIMTSANFTDEPLISRESELKDIMGSIADFALVHNREIAHKCDDSILFVCNNEVVPVRRARGYVPEPVKLLDRSGKCIVALGGHVKGTFAISRGEDAFVSAHLGDLDDIRSQENFKRELESFTEILKVRPEVCVHDMHPDYFTTRFAREMNCKQVLSVQHHHAHAVSVMVEHRLRSPVLAVSFDGTGFGNDGKLWGGEFLLCTLTGFERLAHLKYVPLPGGESAISEPWRMALVYMIDAYGESVVRGKPELYELFRGAPVDRLLGMIRVGINSPLTSSIGRLFDAVSFVLGFRRRISFEAEAAIALESLALMGEPQRSYEFRYIEGRASIEIDPAFVVRGIVEDYSSGVEPEVIACSFHSSVARMIVKTAEMLATGAGTKDIVLSGGVFQNRLLLQMTYRLAEKSDFNYYSHILVPPNDGGISLGQLEIASATIGEEIE